MSIFFISLSCKDESQKINYKQFLNDILPGEYGYVDLGVYHSIGNITAGSKEILAFTFDSLKPPFRFITYDEHQSEMDKNRIYAKMQSMDGNYKIDTYQMSNQYSGHYNPCYLVVETEDRIIRLHFSFKYDTLEIIMSGQRNY